MAKLPWYMKSKGNAIKFHWLWVLWQMWKAKRRRKKEKKYIDRIRANSKLDLSSFTDDELKRTLDVMNKTTLVASKNIQRFCKAMQSMKSINK